MLTVVIVISLVVIKLSNVDDYFLLRPFDRGFIF